MKDQLVEQPKYSIIIAAYNIEEYIERAIESVENQTYKNYELIIVNDCSRDHTARVIRNNTQKYDNIIFVQNEMNKKVGGARNTALSIAKGNYILFLNGDDVLADNTVLEKLDNTIGNNEFDITYLGFKIDGDNEKVIIPTEETCTISSP